MTYYKVCCYYITLINFIDDCIDCYTGVVSSYEQLARCVETEDVSLLLVTGVPRSMSTALCRSLSMTKDIDALYVNEPFNRNIGRTEDAATAILAAAQSHFPIGTDSKKLLIVKNMASYLPRSSYQDFEAIASQRLWTVRHPLVQMGSLVTRIANDLHTSGSDDLNPEEVYAYLDSVDAFLEDSEKSQKYSKTGWQAILELFEAQIDDNYCVVDGERLANNASSALQVVCAASDISFDAAMVTNWSDSNNFINVVNIGNETETQTNAWTRQAATATGIAQNSRAPLDIAHIPERMREHILEVAMPIYAQLSEVAV